MRRIWTRAVGLVLAAVGLFAGASPAQAGFVNVVVAPDPFTDYLNPTGVEFTFSNSGKLPAGAILFDLFLTPADVGTTFAADPTTADFATMAASLTNGVDDGLGLFVSPDGTSGEAKKKASKLDEGTFFNNPGWATGTGPPDLAGYTLNGVTLTLDSLSITPSGTYDQTTGDAMSNISFQGTLTFGVDPIAAPAPPGVLLGLSGIASLFGFGWLRRRMAM